VRKPWEKRTCPWRRAGFLARAAAGLAGLIAGNLELGLEPVRSLLERDLEPVLEVFAAPRSRAAPAAAAEEPLEEILDDGAEADVAGASAEPRGGAEAVVVRALVRIREHGVRFADLLEALLGPGVARVLVRVVLAGEGAVDLLQLGVVGAPADAEDPVVVLGRHVRTGRGSRPP
jgi:hypothetical protein